MKAIRFRVRNYRNIDDSGWIPLERVTAFVGRNESGKTSLLKALHKFNPATPEPYDAQREFPRDRYARDYASGGAKGGDWPVCSIEFEIPGRLRERLARLLDGDREPPATVTLTRHYDGSLAFQYTPEVEDRPLAPDPVVNALHDLASGARWQDDEVPDQEGAGATQHRDLADWATAWNDRLKGVADLRTVESAELVGTLRDEANERNEPQTSDLVNALVAVLEPILEVAGRGSAVARINEAIEKRLPVLIYFENYGILDSAIWLPQFLEDLERDPFNPRVRTVNAIFRHVGLDPRQIAELGGERAGTNFGHGARPASEWTEGERCRKEERAIRLNSASLDISRKFSAWWSQRRHKIRYHADGDYFRVWVTDDLRPDVEIELEARSRGFQWFFSFYLVFLAESGSRHQNAMLLLDEPGLHLHPTAQRELIAFLDKLSEKNQLAYTTHSPFLIDGEHLHRVRPVTEDDTGHSRVASETWAGNSETIFTLQAAAGYAMMDGLFRGRENVLVEGMSDFYYLHMLSQQCASTGRTSLPTEARITPCGGAKNVAYIASLFLARDFRPIVLLDGDDAAEVRGDALTNDLHLRQDCDVLMLEKVLNRPGQEVGIEDILGEEAVLAGLEAVLAKPLTLTDRNGPGGGLRTRIEAEARRQAIGLPAEWRTTAARSLVASWAATGTLLPDHVLDAAASLFSALTERFGQADRDDVPVAEVPEHAVEDDPDLLRLLLLTVGEDEGGDAEEAEAEGVEEVAGGDVDAGTAKSAMAPESVP